MLEIVNQHFVAICVTLVAITFVAVHGYFGLGKSHHDGN
jgi:hypothetical protein